MFMPWIDHVNDSFEDLGGSRPCDVVAKILDSGFNLLPHYYVLFQTNTLGKGKYCLISPPTI